MTESVYGVTLADVLASAAVYSLPLTRTFRGVTEREGVLLQGPSGWGEFAPFLEYDDATTARWLAAALEAAYGNWPWPQRHSIPVNAIIPACSPADAASLAYRAYVGDGCSTVKVKVAEKGQTLDDDIARIAAVRAGMQSAAVRDPRIRVDANGGWSLPEAITAIRELDEAAGGLEYVEQPCWTLDELREVRRQVSVPIAADESIRTAEDPVIAAKSGAVDAVVVKVPPLGGVHAALRVAEAAGVPVIISGAMDSTIGLCAGIAAAAALPHLPYACGLGTGALLADDLVNVPLRPSYGQLAVDRRYPDSEALDRAANRLPDERKRWWLARIERAWERL